MQGWQPGDYQILFRILEEWGQVSVLLIVKDFGGSSEKDLWMRVWNHLEKSLKEGGDTGFSVALSLAERGQVEQGGVYSIPEGFVEEEHLMNTVVHD